MFILYKLIFFLVREACVTVVSEFMHVFVFVECLNQPWDDDYVNVCGGDGDMYEMPADSVDTCVLL